MFSSSQEKTRENAQNEFNVDHDGYLVGQLLVATPLITTSCFHKSIVYIFAHDEDGAMGLILNQPLELVHYTSVLEQMHITPSDISQDIPVHYGGPVDRSRGFVVYDNSYACKEVLATHNGINVTASAGILHDIAKGEGPEKCALAIGYAGWAPGQLEAELEQNSWITVPATPQLLFDLDNDMKWGMASQSVGVDMNFYSTTVGHA